MNHRMFYSTLEMSDLAEGVREIGEALEPANALKASAMLIIRHKRRIKSSSAGEGRGSQIGVTLEGIEEDDAQDASLTTDEWRPARHAQTVLRVSSNPEPTVFMLGDIPITEARE